MKLCGIIKEIDRNPGYKQNNIYLWSICKTLNRIKTMTKNVKWNYGENYDRSEYGMVQDLEYLLEIIVRKK